MTYLHITFMHEACTTETSLWVLTGEGTATNARNQHRHSVLLVHNLAGPDCKEFFGVLPKPLSCSHLYIASKCECMVYEG